MDPPFQFLDEMIKLKNPNDELEISWSKLHISIFDHYFLYLSDTCEVGEIRLSELLEDTVWTESGSSAISAKVRVSLAQELQSVFMVPRLNKFHKSRNHIKKHQLVEAFISFLFQLLYHKTDSIIDSCLDRLENVEKELRFLRTVLGDTSFMRCADEHEVEFQKLITGFEVVVNGVGSLLHYLLLSTGQTFEKLDEGVAVFFNHMELLKDDIVKFLPLISRDYTAPETSVMNSIQVVDSLIYLLNDLMNRENYVDDPIKNLYAGLISLQSSIKEIGGQQPSENRELRENLMLIGNVAHEAQYLVISFSVGDAPHWYLIKRLTNVNLKIELCGTELQQIIKKQNSGELMIVLSLGTNKNTEVDDCTVGFEDKETYILDKLAGGGAGVQVISIFGMPGLGKTTLAKKLYNHPLVSDRFDKLSWCVVSQTYELRGLLATILINIETNFGKDRILNMEEERLIEHIHKTLKERRYFIALDDVWDSKVLEELVRCFPDDGNGSRILFTTRNKDVAQPSSIMYEMPRLTNNQCWELLERKVFGNQPCPQKLQGIGRQIAVDCKGLPLAVVVIAGILLTTEKEESTWEEVRGNLASYISYDGDNSVMQILKLSYKNLPQYLKPCFLYFGAFQKDKEIPVGKLIKLWVAEGFICMENKETKAVDYLMELINRSLIMVVKRKSDGGVKTCEIHDLLRDLCVKTCEEENYLRFVESAYCSIFNDGDHLRTLQYSVTWSYCQNMRSLFGRSMMLPLHIRDMRLLRVLQFDCRSTYLTGIEFLVCLRYLIVRDLPPSVGYLVNLEYLHIETNETVRLSSAILTMKKLRYICVGSEAIYDKDCDSSQTNNLEFFSRIVIEEPKDEEMLKCSPRLCKLKLSAYRHVDLSILPQLESLNIRFYDLGIEGIIFPSIIKKLTLFGTALTTEEMSIIGRLENLEVLKLRFISFEDERWDIKDDKFQKLKFFKLKVENLTEWNVDSSEHFPVLEQLVLSDCGNLHEIPFEIFEITALQLIEIQGICRKSLLESAKYVQQEQVDMGYEELRIITNSAHLGLKARFVCLLYFSAHPEGNDVSIGLEAELENVLGQLVGGGKFLQAISILGMPGLGKTTLAKKLYNHPLVCNWFDKLSWCVVSRTYMGRSLLTKILIQLVSEVEKGRILKLKEESIGKYIYKSLKGKRYLIVMDDIWDSDVWDDLWRYFPDDANGSRILFTSRDTDAIPLGSKIHVLTSLSNDQCWELLEKKVFDGEPCPPQLLEIGKRIAANCRGLPYAVVVTAGIISSMDKELETTWEEVGKNFASYIFSGGNNSVIECSFQSLPEYLRPCLLYLGVFHGNEQINVRELLRFWIAEGFIGKERGKSAENVAEEYLKEIINKNLAMVVERRSDGGVKTCVVHDLVRHLCLQICEGDKVQISMSGEGTKGAGWGSRLLEHIRSLLGRRWTSPSCVRDTRSLRILRCGYIDSCYTGIEFLVCLKYLVIRELPPDIGGFVNLEYLRVENDEEVYLPSAIMKMKKLECIKVRSVARYDTDCETSQTSNLEFLSGIQIREPHDEEMLQCSPHLRKLKLSTYRNVDLHFLDQLESLSTRFFDSGMGWRIVFPPNIKKLTFCSSENKLSWKNSLPVIGRLQNLEVLKLNWSFFKEDRWVTNDDEFLKLRFLKLDGVIDLSCWNVESSGHFRRLERLILRNCYNLVTIPPEIGKIPTLKMIEVQGKCLKSLVESAERIQQEQHQRLRVIVTDAHWEEASESEK